VVGLSESPSGGVSQRCNFVLVGGGAAKADEPREAGNPYTSSYFALKRQDAVADDLRCRYSQIGLCGQK
jgi:hypothetical protein